VGHFAVALVEWVPFFWHGVEMLHVDITGKHTSWYKEPSPAKIMSPLHK
jgi:hypothetical protein